MTSQERINAALHHREPDRTPIFEYVLLSPVADRLLGRTYGGDPANWAGLVEELGWEGAVRRNAVDRVDLAVLLGHDMLYVTPNPPPHRADDNPVQPHDPLLSALRRGFLRHRFGQAQFPVSCSQLREVLRSQVYPQHTGTGPPFGKERDFSVPADCSEPT